MVNLEVTTATKLLSFFDFASKKYVKQQKECKETEQELLNVYSDLTALILELLNNIITLNLNKNKNLVYILLQHKQGIKNLQCYERFETLCYNILQAVEHYERFVEEADLEIPTVEDVLGIIEIANLTWSKEKIIALEVVKFGFEDNISAHKFFLPFIWALLLEKREIWT
jgi:hypothetical protein